ncbi:M48 family metalloprotease [Sphingomonas sanguinis]|jgi:predicted Zn-dependent protease|uniref:M48 family metalloprotease n=1 Tax=Sphingomonas sanguinis TaxID=33051 RepID=A0A7Y7QXM5_9SPHN|nr:M48 family metalloprotease [Sphingomonas sanguinis]MBZ6383280.1 M48 family metalloprotease [Sphingomonas sanguinis]NNG49944.1 M48 family metalloprotease [Sphingomonas sanguinis]NNG53719.1 M48 family metalloprotease [Sphingomonas sanguinis]NVP32575.1 M48 family metalloprotease [Sphingomonas sanguinis]
MKRLIAAFAATAVLWAQPAAAQSILRDAETEALFADMSAPIIKAAGLNPHDVKIVLINDDSINAFVAGGQIVYVHSGLLQAAENVNEVQGVVAHELGHIADGHVVLSEQAMKPAMKMQLLSMVLGLATVALGGGAAGMGMMAAGQQAAMSNVLAFSRNQESAADAAGARYLTTAGVTGKGMLSFFKKLQNQEYRYGYTNIDPFAQTHPLSAVRIQSLTDDLKASPAWNKPVDAKLQERFLRVKAKLLGYVSPPEQTLNKYPDSDQSVYAHYARAYAYHKGGYPDKAEAEAAALIARDPKDPYFQEIEGQILLESGKPQEALAPLRAATMGSGQNALIATTFGHALIATEDKRNLPEAVKILKVAVQRDEDNPFAWVQLGTAYEQLGDTPRAALATAERASMMGDDRTAIQSARYAMANLTPNTSEWIRAQDIAMTSADSASSKKKKHR